jgi:tetratricopeptide (TPR) repeat protein
MAAKTRIFTIAIVGLLIAAVAGFSPYLLREWSHGDKPEPLLAGLGDYSRTVTTSSPEAQHYFDQGLLLLSAYNYEEAVRSFRAAASADPSCAMAYWGIAMADRGTAQDVITQEKQRVDGWHAARKAEQLTGAASPLEQQLIRAMGLQYREKEPTEPGRSNEAYAAAMSEIWKKNPDDPDIAAWTAEATSRAFKGKGGFWTADGKLQPGADVVIGPLETGLAKHPDHLFLLHLWFHLTEDKVPQKCRDVAERLRKLTPDGLGHLLHMPAHIDIQFGEWQKAFVASERAIAADDDYAKNSIPGDGYRYLMAHTYHMFIYIAAMQGRSQKSNEAVQGALALLTPDFVKRRIQAVDFMFAMPFDLHLRFGEWDAMLTEPPPSEKMHPLAAAKWHFARGVAFAAKHQVTEARFEHQCLVTARQTVPPDALVHRTAAAAILAIDDALLDGEVLYREGKVEQAVDQLKMAVALEDGLEYSEPPDLMQPARHVLGAVLMDVGRYPQAEAVYREDLRRHPENGWSLYGLSRSLKKQKKTAEAAAVAARFERAWQHADIKLTASCLCLPEKD